MKLYKALKLDLNKANNIAIVGGGGKTTTLRILATELKNLGLSVLNATSTGIFCPKEEEYDNLFIGSLPADFIPPKGTITYVGQVKEGVKLKLKNIEFIDEIINRSTLDIVLMEADGSKGLPIKAPSNHEPVISKHTTMTIGVIGLDSLGTSIDETNVHRPDVLREITKATIVNIDTILSLVKHKEGLFKNSRGEKILILNKACNEDRIRAGREIKKALSGENLIVIIADILSGNYDII